MKTAAVIVAAGRGSRAGMPLPKQYMLAGAGPVLGLTRGVFLAHPAVHLVQVVIGAQDNELYAGLAGGRDPRLLPPVSGGATRQASVLCGLQGLRRHSPDRVLIHDGARPFVTRDLIARVLDALDEASGAIAALPLADSLKRADQAGLIATSVDRAGLWRAQTPQGFRFAEILAAHERAAAAGLSDFTDDAAVAEWAGLSVRLVLGSEANRKLTTAEDFAMLIEDKGSEVRIGSGFDVHRLVAGKELWLCGVQLPHTHGLEGHSDADVALHALTDALLGAIGEADIGQHFPDNDPRWKGAASSVFAAEAARRVRAKGGSIGNVDITILCEAPKIAPHREAMRSRIAQILELRTERVSVKATTTEGLGFTGRREGIAALASATVILPQPPTD